MGGWVGTYVFRARPSQQLEVLLLHVPRIQVLELHLTRAPPPKNEDLVAGFVHHTGVGDASLRGHAP